MTFCEKSDFLRCAPCYFNEQYCRCRPSFFAFLRCRPCYFNEQYCRCRPSLFHNFFSKTQKKSSHANTSEKVSRILSRMHPVKKICKKYVSSWWKICHVVVHKTTQYYRQVVVWQLVPQAIFQEILHCTPN
jgi:hypothetical protein